MGINYRTYEPNQGLEEFQAKLYNQANNRNVTAKEIQERYEREKIDPKTVRYAFTKDGKPLAYVQARDYPAVGETHIGYPWIMPDCPLEVKNKLYDDLLAYVKTRKTDLKIKMNVQADRVDFAKQRGFKEEQKFIRYKIKFDTLKNYNPSDSKYVLRKAAEDELEAIKKGYIEAYNLTNPAEIERLTNYTKDRFKENHLIVATYNNAIIGGTAPFIEEGEPNPENIGALRLRFLFTIKGHEISIPELFKKSMELSHEANWDNHFILITFSDENPDELSNLDKISSEKTIMGIKLALEL